MCKTAIETLKAESEGINNLIDNFQTEKFEQAVEIILNAKGKVIFTGLGKTGHIAKKLAATFASTGTPAFFLHSTESNHGDMGMVDFKNDVLVSISHSGESNESFNTIRICKEQGMKIITMTNNDDSTIAKHGDVNLKNFVAKEACPLGLAPTTSTTVTLALGDALATEVMARKNFTPADFGLSHPAGKLGRRLLKASSNEVMVELPAITNDLTLKQALTPMNKYRLGCLVILNDDQTLAGFVSQGDFNRALESEGLDCPITQAMTKNPSTISADDLGVAGYNIMREKDISSIIVMQDNKPIGILDIKKCRHLFN